MAKISICKNNYSIFCSDNIIFVTEKSNEKVIDIIFRSEYFFVIVSEINIDITIERTKGSRGKILSFCVQCTFVLFIINIHSCFMMRSRHIDIFHQGHIVSSDSGL